MPARAKCRAHRCSFTNWLDAESAHRPVSQFDEPAAAIVKHTNPCGFAIAADIASAYRLASQCDPRAAYGGVVGLNRAIDDAIAQSLIEIFLNVVVAPGVIGTRLRQASDELERRSARLDGVIGYDLIVTVPTSALGPQH